jgi:hypothetical protein
MWRSRGSRLLLAMVASVVLLGCSGGAAGQGGAGGPLQEPGAAREGDAAAQGGSSGSPGGGEQPSGGAGGGGGTPGDQGNQGGGGAVPAPINIPEFQQIGAGNVDQIRGQIEAAIRYGCRPRGELCISVKVVPRGDSHPTCFGGTNPDTSNSGVALDPREVKVFTIYSGSNPSAIPCEPDPGSGESGGSGEESSESTGSTGSTGSTESTASTGSTGSGGSSESSGSAPEEGAAPQEDQSPPTSS